MQLYTPQVQNNPRMQVQEGGALRYTPKGSPRDYGTFSCWAINPVGTQAEPCRFTIVEAGEYQPCGHPGRTLPLHHRGSR